MTTIAQSAAECLDSVLSFVIGLGVMLFVGSLALVGLGLVVTLLENVSSPTHDDRGRTAEERPPDGFPDGSRRDQESPGPEPG